MHPSVIDRIDLDSFQLRPDIIHDAHFYWEVDDVVIELFTNFEDDRYRSYVVVYNLADANGYRKLDVSEPEQAVFIVNALLDEFNTSVVSHDLLRPDGVRERREDELLRSAGPALRRAGIRDIEFV